MKALAPEYLATARLGRMSSTAQVAVRDFVRLTGEGALPLYSPEFFWHGVSQGRFTFQNSILVLTAGEGLEGCRRICVG